MGKKRNVSKRKKKKYNPNKKNKAKNKKSDSRTSLLVAIIAVIVVIYLSLPVEEVDISQLVEITVLLDDNVVEGDDQSMKVLWSQEYNCTFQIENAGIHNHGSIELNDLRQGDILHLKINKKDFNQGTLQNESMYVNFYSVRTDEFIVFSAEDYNDSQLYITIRNVLIWLSLIAFFYYVSQKSNI